MGSSNFLENIFVNDERIFVTISSGNESTVTRTWLFLSQPKSTFLGRVGDTTLPKPDFANFKPPLVCMNVINFNFYLTISHNFNCCYQKNVNILFKILSMYRYFKKVVFHYYYCIKWIIHTWYFLLLINSTMNRAGTFIWMWASYFRSVY